MHRARPLLVHRSQGGLSTGLTGRLSMRSFGVFNGWKAADQTYMWISVRSVGTMADVFALPAFNSGDTCVSGTLAAVRGTPAR